MIKIWPERHAQFKTFYDQNGRKTIPFGAAYTSVAHISEYPPGFMMDGVSCEDMMDHPSYTHDLNSCEIKPEKIQAWTEFEPEPMTCDTGSELYQLSY